MIQIKQFQNSKVDVATVFSQDLIWLCLGLMVGFVIPFMTWLFVVTHLSSMFLTQIV